MSGEKKRALKEIDLEHRRALGAFSRTGLHSARREFDAAAGSIVRGVSRAARGKHLTPETIARARTYLSGQQPKLLDGFSHVLSGTTEDTMRTGIKSIGFLLSRVQKIRNPVHTDMVERIVAARMKQIEAMRAASAKALASRLQLDVSTQMRRSALSGAAPKDLIGAIEEKLHESWWQVVRTVRTETAYAYCRAQSDAIEIIAEDPEFAGKLYSRWTECVDDLTGRPLDNRVARDSMVMHAQVTLPGGSFTMPFDPGVSSKLVGMSWAHPPNRPNDRAILTPWMREWGIRGWEFRGGRKHRV